MSADPMIEDTTHDNTEVQDDSGLLIEELATMPDKAILDETKLAEILHVVPRTIRRMVDRGELPPSIKLGGRSVWFAGRVLSWIENAAERAERDAAKRAEKLTKLAP